MAEYAVGKLRGLLGDLSGARVLILGLAYRGDVKEAAFSSTFKLVEALKTAGADALVHDPLYSGDEIASYGLTPATLNPLPDVRAIILQANHREYENLDWAAIPGCEAVLDGRAALSREQIPGEMALLWIGRS
jgi:UDP-N-acetyl-D-mannosaminuronate dehydrogenase